jgi:hypothetical protein
VSKGFEIPEKRAKALRRYKVQAKMLKVEWVEDNPGK